MSTNGCRIYGSSGGSSGGETSNGTVGRRSRPAQAADKQKGPKECKLKLLKLLGMRDYSVASMRSKLSDAGFADADIEAALDYATSSGLMDDSRYAESFIASKKELGWGRGRIERALSEKGVDCEQLEGYPDAFFSQEEELERAKKCLMSHHTSAKNVRDSHYRYLLSKGFSTYIASCALRECGRDED